MRTMLHSVAAATALVLAPLSADAQSWSSTDVSVSAGVGSLWSGVGFGLAYRSVSTGSAFHATGSAFGGVAGGTYDDGTYDPGSYDDGAYGDAYYDDEYYDDGYYDDGYYD
ncbi:MAG: hypothetical protein KC645_12950, partial [Gemmatimonadetes bacterium]|nr:hypothetical protein [Gemmatimonadota bacterium]